MINNTVFVYFGLTLTLDFVVFLTYLSTYVTFGKSFMKGHFKSFLKIILGIHLFFIPMVLFYAAVGYILKIYRG